METRDRSPRVDPPAEDVLRELERVLGGDELRSAPRLSRFLRYLVDETLAGRAAALKEYSVGVDVFDRGDSFDPRNDPIVRVQARNLRRRLSRHYLDSERRAELVIEVPKGGYVPTFRRRSADPTPSKRRLWLLGLGAALGLAVLVASAWDHKSTPARLRFQTGRAVTFGQGSESGARFSPNGRRLAYSSQPDGGGPDEIFVQYVDSESDRRIRVTYDPQEDRTPAWSPDGDLLVFARFMERSAEAGEYRFQLVVARPIEGSSERVLGEFRTPFRRVYPAWAPDGRHIVFSCRIDAPVGSTQLCVYSLETSESRPLTAGANGAEEKAVFRPDGLALAFETLGSSGIWILPLDEGLESSGEPHSVAAEFFGRPVGWSIDGETLYFTGMSPQGEGGLWAIDPEAFETPRFLVTMGRAQPGSSPSLWAGRSGDLRLIRKVAEQRLDIVRVDLHHPSHPAEPLIAANGSDSDPRFSPDGSRLAFISTRTGRFALWTSEVDGSNAELLCEAPAFMGSAPAWSPDGRRVAFDAMLTTKTNDVYLVDIASRRVGPSLGPGRWPSWSPSSDAIYYGPTIAGVSGSAGIWRLDPESGESELVLDGFGKGADGSIERRRRYIPAAQWGPHARSSGGGRGHSRPAAYGPARRGLICAR